MHFKLLQNCIWVFLQPPGTFFPEFEKKKCCLYVYMLSLNHKNANNANFLCEHVKNLDIEIICLFDSILSILLKLFITIFRQYFS